MSTENHIQHAMTLKTSSSKKQLCLSKYQQKYFSLGFFSPLHMDTVSYHPFSFPCLAHQQPWGSQGELKHFPCPCGTWGSTCNPASIQAFGGSTVELLPFPLCPWRISPSKAQWIKLRMVSQPAHSLQKLWQLNLAAFHISCNKEMC